MSPWLMLAATAGAVLGCAAVLAAVFAACCLAAGVSLADFLPRNLPRRR